MEKPYTAIVLDGFHSGHVVRVRGYLPVLRLLKPTTTTVDYCCGGDEIETKPPEELEYHAAFHGVDRSVVLYTRSGKSDDILSIFPWERTFLPWNYNTYLQIGYHHEPIIRKDDGTHETEYERGVRDGIKEGRILQAKEHPL